MVQLTADGNVSMWSANREGGALWNTKLSAGTSLIARYQLTGTDCCGAVSIVPTDWQFGCRGEHTMTLGNVDFAVLGGSSYPARPQADRTNILEVEFLRDADGARIVTRAVAGDEVSDQTAKALGKSTLAAVFISFSEPLGVPGATGRPSIGQLRSGGVVKFSSKGGTQVPTGSLAEISV
jgi:hypothetical protein